MPEQFPGMRMWEEIKRESGNKKTNFTFGAGVRGKQSFKKREVTCV